MGFSKTFFCLNAGGECMLQTQELEKVIHEEMKKLQIPGLAIAVVHKQEIIYAKGFGMTSVEDNGVQVTPDTLFRIGSVTKLLTATVIMKCVERELLDLDKPLIHYIPWLRLHDENAASSLTLRILLTHTSGYINGGDVIGKRDPEGLEEYVRRQLPEIHFHAPPGKVYAYSNHNINLAGFVVQYVTGRPFAALMQEELFDPLHMQRTTFDPLVALTYPLALAHVQHEGELRVNHQQMVDNTACHPSFFAMSTVTDLARFAMLHLNRGIFGGEKHLAAETIAEMHAQQFDFYSHYPSGVGLAFHLQERWRGYKLSRHFGDISSYSSDFVMLPEHETAVILMNNMPSFPHNKVTDMILAQLFPDMKESTTYLEQEHLPLPAIEGTYLGEWPGLIEIQRVDDQLVLTKNKQESYVVRPYLPDRLKAYNQSGEEKMIVGYLLEEESEERYLFLNNVLCNNVLPPGNHQPTEEELQSYCGCYAHHGQTDWSYVITKEEHELFLRDDGTVVKLLPIERHVFVSPGGGTIRFVQDEAGEVNAFLLATGWRMHRMK
jgi:CubicO group peptidase (beta-lactamase class C family)